MCLFAAFPCRQPAAFGSLSKPWAAEAWSRHSGGIIAFSNVNFLHCDWAATIVVGVAARCTSNWQKPAYNRGRWREHYPVISRRIYCDNSAVYPGPGRYGIHGVRFRECWVRRLDCRVWQRLLRCGYRPARYCQYQLRGDSLLTNGAGANFCDSDSCRDLSRCGDNLPGAVCLMGDARSCCYRMVVC